MARPEPFRLAPDYHARVWGGRRLRTAEPPIGEAWVVHDANTVLDGPHAGRSLAEATAADGPALLGRRLANQADAGFPLLIKLLDTADWLSLQVHPDDAQAARLEGPGARGKTEAWHFLEAEPEASVICGLRPGVEQAALAAAIRGGGLLDLVERRPVQAGETLLMPAGTVHALGPGLLLYEVQQSSNLTYRVYDWDRPATAGRALHIEQSLAVADANARGQATPPPALADGEVVTLTSCAYFTLRLAMAEARPLVLDTGGATFHALTAAAGEALVEGDGWSRPLGRLESLLVPAACGAYAVNPRGALRLLLASAEAALA